MLKSNIKNALDYVYSLQGTKYGWWNIGDDQRYIEHPAYAINKKVPSKMYIKNKSINCVGVINLMRRINNLSIPGTENPNFKVPGGTYIWFKHLNNQNKLHTFNINKKYPRGTLLLSNYKNNLFQGHVAVLYRANSAHPTIIHSWSNDTVPNKFKSDPGLVKERLDIFIDEFPKYLTHVCLPEDWLI